MQSARENNGIMTPALMWEVASGGCGGCTTIEGAASVTGRPDGAEETVATGDMYLDSSDYELMHYGDEQIVAVVFPSADIPAGSTLDDVKIGDAAVILTTARPVYGLHSVTVLAVVLTRAAAATTAQRTDSDGMKTRQAAAYHSCQCQCLLFRPTGHWALPVMLPLTG
jgi:hypothetical protein